MAFFADDCTFYMARGPEPCGRRVHGKEAVRKVLADRFGRISGMRWDHIHAFVAGNRAVTVWTVTGRSADGEVLNYRGCDLYEFRGDKNPEQGHVLEAGGAGRPAVAAPLLPS